MTDEDFYRRVRALGLKPTKIATVFITLDEQTPFSVPKPSELTELEKESYLEQLALLVGRD